MSEVLELVFNGTEIMFNSNKKILIKRIKSLDAKKEIRIAKARMRHSVIQRSSNRVRMIADEALSE
ncbi:hypothetical protein [Sulfurimonas sp.]|uniref:hypothetical protein n=1 Tax=Sulfurimonas sp. TaxID=2022749 RepID=UPI002B45C6E3|nr:hypothetical protein [Sulfurimonas sp.]